MRIKIISSRQGRWYYGCEGMVVDVAGRSDKYYIITTGKTVKQKDAIEIHDGFVVGDLVECFLYGKGKVISVAHNDERYTVAVSFGNGDTQRYTSDGRRSVAHRRRTLYHIDTYAKLFGDLDDAD